MALRLGGIDIGGLRARQVQAEDFHHFDHIVAMDHSNLRNLSALAPAGAVAQLSLLLDHLPGHEGRAVADPYYGDERDFQEVFAILSRSIDAFLDEHGSIN